MDRLSEWRKDNPLIVFDFPEYDLHLLGTKIQYKAL